MSWEKYNEWLTHGVAKGWISIPVCDTHDGLPLSALEIEQWDNRDDICIPVVRLYGHEIIFNDQEEPEIPDNHPVL